MDDLNSIQSTLYSLVQRFVQRQAIVLEAMRDLRPDLVAEAGDEIPPQFIGENRKEYLRKFYKGHWGKDKEWEYYLHGGGCRLIHTVTQERIEWDAGSLLRFDRFWFANYVEWLLNQDVEDENLTTFREWFKKELSVVSEKKPVFMRHYDVIFPLLERLEEQGLLSCHEQYCTLIPQEDADEQLR
jgi:hypothetical protein